MKNVLLPVSSPWWKLWNLLSLVKNVAKCQVTRL